MPKISVIVPVYNVEPYIHRCIDSILAQTFTDFELILVDDGSPDNCGKICDEYAEKDNRIHVIHQENGGLSAARNAGLDWTFANSDSEWINFIDSDDWVEDKMLEILITVAENYNVNISICDYYVAKNHVTNCIEYIPDVEKITPEDIYQKRSGLIDLSWGKLYKKELFFNIRFPVGKIFEDAWTTYKVVFSEKFVVVTDAKLYAYFCNEESITRKQWSDKWLSEVDAHNEQLNFFANNYPSILSTAVFNYICILEKQFVAIDNSNICSKKKYKKLILKNMRRTLRKYRDIINKTDKSRGAWEFCHRRCSSVFGIMRSIKRRIRTILNMYINLRYSIGFEKMLSAKCDISIELANKIIKQERDEPRAIFSQKTIISPNNHNLMIVIPVYNTDEYIEECVESIIHQKTKYSYLAVFIDDGSTDRSGEILDKYIEYDCVKVIHQENRGFSGARNRALETIEGEYIMFVDSDDYIPNNAVQTLLDEAYKHNADIVEGGFTCFWKDTKFPSQVHNERSVVYTPNKLTGYPWGKVIKSELFEDLCFPQNILFEDTIIKTLLYPKCRVFATVPEVVYYYRQNPKSISHTCRDSVRCIDTYWITKLYLQEMKKREYIFGVDEYEHFLLQCQRNYTRVSKMSKEIQMCVFTLECSLRDEFFNEVVCPDKKVYRLSEKALKNKSFDAFCFLQNHWNDFQK